MNYQANQDINKEKEQEDKIDFVQYFDKRQSFFYGLSEIQSIVQKQEKSDNIIDKAIKCDPDILTLFSITGPQIYRARKNDNIKEQYCDSQYICCSGDHIKQMIPKIAESIYRLRRKYQPYFNIITLFKSKHIRNFLQQNNKHPNCSQILNDQQEILSEDEIAFFKIPLGRQSENLDDENLEDLYKYADLTDFENYKKFMRRIDVIKVDLDYFLDLQEQKAKAVICNLCDAFQQTNLKVNLESDLPPHFQISSSICLDVYWEQRLFFEFNLLNKIFFTRLTEFFLCVKEQMWTFSTSRDVYQTQQKRQVPKKKCTIQLSNKKLFDPSKQEDKECLKFCDRLYSLNEPFLQNKIIATIKKNVAVVYEIFSNKSLAQLYKEDFGKDYFIGMETQRIMTFPQLSIFGQRTSIRSLEYKFDLHNGYSDTFSLPLEQFNEEVAEEYEKIRNSQSNVCIFMQFILYFVFILFQFNYQFYNKINQYLFLLIQILKYQLLFIISKGIKLIKLD